MNYCIDCNKPIQPTRKLQKTTNPKGFAGLLQFRRRCDECAKKYAMETSDNQVVTMPDFSRKYLTTKQASDSTGLKHFRLRRASNNGTIATYRKNKRIYYEVDSLVRYCVERGIDFDMAKTVKSQYCSECGRPCTDFAGKIIVGAKKCALCARRLTVAGIEPGIVVAHNKKLTEIQTNILKLCYKNNGSIRPREVSEANHYNRHSVYCGCLSLARTGYLERVGDKKDEKVYWKLTERGLSFVLQENQRNGR